MQGKVFKIGFRSILKESVISYLESFLKKKKFQTVKIFIPKKNCIYAFFLMEAPEYTAIIKIN